MTEVRYLTASDVQVLAAEFFAKLGHAAPILRSNGLALLESALGRAQHTAYYTDADLIAQAAALANGIALNHPFIDGNKRTAYVTCVAFLESNGLPVQHRVRRSLAEQLIAIHEITDRSEADGILTAWLRERLKR